MATAVSVVVFILCVTVVPLVSAGDDCKSYRDAKYQYQSSQDCMYFCCGSCANRYCCMNPYNRLSKDAQDDCPISNFDFEESPTVLIASSIAGAVIVVLLAICCCVCPCCCLYKMCRRPTPVIATTTHTTVTTQYPQQPAASPSQAYQAAQYPAYQPVPVQPGYGGQPMQPGYGGQHVQSGYGVQPMPTAPYQGQTYMQGPPPPYQEAGAGYSQSAVPYSQAAFSPGQSPYPLQPPAQTGQLPPQTNQHSAQPAYNPAYVEPPPTGY